MAGVKRLLNDENIPPYPLPTSSVQPQFSGIFQDGLKRRRVVRHDVTEDELCILREQQAAEEAKEMEKRVEEMHIRAEAEEAAYLAEEQTRLWRVVSAITDCEFGYGTLYEFLDALVNTKDCAISSQVSKMLISKGDLLLGSLQKRSPEVVNNWATQATGEILAREGAKLAQHLRPQQGIPLGDVLSVFSLEWILSDAEMIAPHLCKHLCEFATSDTKPSGECKNRDLVSSLLPYDILCTKFQQVLVTVICMLAQSWNGHSTEFQTSTCIYLLACGASRSQFDVLNHAGFTLSYTLAISKLKQLSIENLRKIVGIAHSKAFMITWDNLNIAFCVGKQRQASKDHFDNGTTATLIPRYGVKFGELSLDLELKRNNRHPVLEFDLKDMLPTLEDCTLSWRGSALAYQRFTLWVISQVMPTI